MLLILVANVDPPRFPHIHAYSLFKSILLPPLTALCSVLPPHTHTHTITSLRLHTPGGPVDIPAIGDTLLMYRSRSVAHEVTALDRELKGLEDFWKISFFVYGEDDRFT